MSTLGRHLSSAVAEARDDLHGRRARGPEYRPALDALRALAVISVLLVHERVSFLRGGGHGVNLFFALSGFLITTLLLREHQRRGAIDLARFYGRRALRLFPALLVLCAFVAAAAVAGHEDLLNVGATLAYGANWVSALSDHSLGMLAHTWSLAVEEQFYLAWPCVVIAIGAAYGARGVLGAAVAGALVSLGARILLQRHGATVDRLLHGTDTTADQLLWGCALAAAVAIWPGRVRSVVRVAFWPAAIFLALVFVRSLPATDAGWTFGYAAVAVAGATVVGRLALFEDRLTRGVALGPVVWLGTISYGMYLWHYPVEYLMPDALSHGTVVPVAAALVATIGIAATSFYVVERPLQRRFHARLVPGATPDPAPSRPSGAPAPGALSDSGVAVELVKT